MSDENKPDPLADVQIGDPLTYDESNPGVGTRYCGARNGEHYCFREQGHPATWRHIEVLPMRGSDEPTYVRTMWLEGEDS